MTARPDKSWTVVGGRRRGRNDRSEDRRRLRRAAAGCAGPRWARPHPDAPEAAARPRRAGRATGSAADGLGGLTRPPRCCCGPGPPTAARRASRCAERARPQRDAAVRLALTLRDSYLPIQGPPGTGKTFTAARQILELIASGRTVGITGPSHSVISNLIGKVYERADELGARRVSASASTKTTRTCIRGLPC